MFRPDVIVEIHFNMKAPDKTIIRTNAKTEALEEILGNWLQDQMFLGRQPETEPADKDVYLIRIGLRIRDDAFGCESDTNNLYLTVGIVMDVLGRLKSLEISDLK